ncbi:MAG: DUF4124 domain-containing protein [Gammaproteobacteria bacterium]|nr:DUF4124 domain-containing protein [Gammaproteobacteria bacterium]
MKFSLFCCLMLWVVSLSAQQVYRWVDSNGHVKFSDKKPQHITDENLKVITIKQKNNFKSLNQIAKDRGQTISQQQQDLEQLTKKNCDVANYNLKLIKAFGEVSLVDQDGNDVILTELEKKQQINLISKQIDIYCD